jgi:acyl-homoserine-lactone acylase
MQTSRLIASTVLGCAVLGTLVVSPVPAQAAQSALQAPTAGAASATFAHAELARLKKAAQRVTILRDKWGIPHVFGKTDADAVFGMVFAQAEGAWPRSRASRRSGATCA